MRNRAGKVHKERFLFVLGHELNDLVGIQVFRKDTVFAKDGDMLADLFAIVFWNRNFDAIFPDVGVVKTSAINVPQVAKPVIPTGVSDRLGLVRTAHA